jgi:hypothetical protein
VLDAVLAAGLQAGVAPVLLLEYYASFYPTMGLGTWAQWRNIGAAFAAYARPGGTWAQRVGAPAGFGITTYSAFNEPDGNPGFPKGPPGPTVYLQALSGLSAGVKLVDASLRVVPGGFMSANAFDDWTLAKLGPLLAPLWNNGTLDAIDLHTYFDVQYAPMAGTRVHSAQSNYDAIRAACGITASLGFHSTEFNFKRRLVNETQAAAGFLTAFWDSFGVVDGAGAPVTAFVMPWNLFNLNTSDTDYGMAVSDDPYVPTARGVTLAYATALLAACDWEWAAADPRASGVYNLTASTCDGGRAGGASLWAWQALPGWTNAPDLTRILLGPLPPSVTQVDV